MKIEKGFFSYSIQVTPQELLDLKFKDDSEEFTQLINGILSSLIKMLN